MFCKQPKKHFGSLAQGMVVCLLPYQFEVLTDDNWENINLCLKYFSQYFIINSFILNYSTEQLKEARNCKCRKKGVLLDWLTVRRHNSAASVYNGRASSLFPFSSSSKPCLTRKSAFSRSFCFQKAKLIKLITKQML